ncbi:nucleotidyltransferase family protein [Paramicrobacterium agarici]|uniref:nucleotidyltransferase family protein n=1 Tax=Paramicrobacterium agarici TaxID=630514 RepID=UPI0011541957|nr:nucleotidyltransferase family protein [Microbacterium agarici]TQO23460.1 putative nucleotidyltransferase-like protein [Microbacterium agarici]
MSTLRRPLATLLVESAAGDRSGEHLPANLDARQLLKAGRMHRVLPALRRRLHGCPEASEWMPILDAQRHQQLLRHMQAGHDLGRVARAFATAGVRWAVSKGPVLSDTVWPHPDMREYTDVDVFVHPADFAAALASLEASGFCLVDRNWPEMRRLSRAEMAMSGPSGFPLDLHWDIAVTPRARSTFRIDLPEMLERTELTPLGTGVTVPVFDPADLLLHVAFHAAQNGANRLVWIADVLHAALNPAVDWQRFAADALRTRVATPVSMVLERVERTFDVVLPTPPRLRSVAASLPGRAARMRDASRPFPGLPDDPGLSGLEFSSARDSALGSLGSALWQWADVRRIEARVRRRGPDINPLDFDIPDAAARRAYLSTVWEVAHSSS